ncbi:CPCC family cysteine-rich protein [Micromonosporaceae bacterium Da 78-11]
MSQFHNVRIDEQPGVRLACPCCGYLTLPSRGGHEICPVCGWDDDGQDDHDADELRGAPNKVSLTEARANFLEFGASERRRIPRVRPPEKSEVQPPGA